MCNLVLSSRVSFRFVASYSAMKNRRKQIILISALVVFSFFIHVALEVVEGRTGDPEWMEIDRQIGSWMDAHRNSSLTTVMTTFTYMGSTISLGFISFVSILFLTFKHQRSCRNMMILSVVLSLALIQSIKHIVGRVRPDSNNWLVPESGLSFPSGHTTASTAILGTLFFVLATQVESRAGKVVITSAGLLIIIAISISRIYLGVHFSTDVVGGLVLGFSVFLTSISVAAIKNK